MSKESTSTQSIFSNNAKSLPKPFALRLSNKKLTIQDYDLKQTIGEGGFAKVKRAVHKLTGETVAVKIFDTLLFDKGQLENIKRQIELQKNLLHQNIAQIYQVIHQNTKIYVIMQHCPKGQLFDRINTSGPMPEHEAAKVFNQVLSALLYLKQNNLSHRDIKPENILFDQNWNAKLIDFGFVCKSQFRRTILGTPSYTPPEMIRKQHYDPQLSDVWSLGVTLYAMLAAQLPFEGITPDQKKANILTCKFAQLPIFSLKAQKLFSSIFTDAKYRITLQGMQNSQFCLSHQTTTPGFIDFKNDMLLIDRSIVDMLDRLFQMNPQKVIYSVQNCKLDRYHAAYYLLIKNQKHAHKNRNIDLPDQYKKQKRTSMHKLQPISSRTPSIKRKESFNNVSPIVNLKLKGLIQSKMKNKPVLAVDTHTHRVRRNSIDSPTRLKQNLNPRLLLGGMSISKQL